jgi:hypothetical protein
MIGERYNLLKKGACFMPLKHFVVFAFLAFLLVGCGNPSSSGDPDKLILDEGKAWVTCVKLFGDSDYCSGYIFKPDGTFSIVVYNESDGSWDVFDEEPHNRWSVSGNQLTLTIVNCSEYIVNNNDGYCASTSETINKVTYSLSGGKLNLSGTVFTVQDITTSNNGKGTDVIGYDEVLIGDWLREFEIVGETNYEIITLKPLGEGCYASYEKIADFGLERSYCNNSWYTKGGNLYHDSFGSTGRLYSISQDSLTVTSSGVWADTSKYKKTTIEAFRNTLGTVYSIDTNLYSTDWVLSTNENSELRLNFLYIFIISSSEQSRYLGNNRYGTDVWYTDGASLFIVSVVNVDGCNNNFACMVSVSDSVVEFRYEIKTVNGRETLTLVNEELGINDVWLAK